MPIVTTSSHKRPKRNPVLPIAITVIVIVAAILLLRVWRRPVAPSLPGPEVSAPSAPTKNVPKTNDEPKQDKPSSQTTSISAEPSTLQSTESSTNSIIEEPEVTPPVTNHVLNYQDHPATQYIKGEADQIIAFAMQATDFTGGMPPLPVMHYADGGNAMFLASLTNEIVILETDSDKVREQKELMISCRAQIKDIIDKGGTFEQAIREYQDRVNENANIRLSAIRKYQELMAQDPDAAEDYRKVVNEELEKEGITPLPEPGSVRRGRRGNSNAQ